MCVCVCVCVCDAVHGTCRTRSSILGFGNSPSRTTAALVNCQRVAPHEWAELGDTGAARQEVIRWPWHLGQSALTSLYRRVDEQDHHVGQQAQADARRGRLASRSSLPALMVVVLPKAVARMLVHAIAGDPGLLLGLNGV